MGSRKGRPIESQLERAYHARRLKPDGNSSKSSTAKPLTASRPPQINVRRSPMREAIQAKLESLVQSAARSVAGSAAPKG